MFYSSIIGVSYDGSSTEKITQKNSVICQTSMENTYNGVMESIFSKYAGIQATTLQKNPLLQVHPCEFLQNFQKILVENACSRLLVFFFVYI